MADIYGPAYTRPSRKERLQILGQKWSSISAKFKQLGSLIQNIYIPSNKVLFSQHKIRRGSHQIGDYKWQDVTSLPTKTAKEIENVLFPLEHTLLADLLVNYQASYPNEDARFKDMFKQDFKRHGARFADPETMRNVLNQYLEPKLVAILFEKSGFLAVIQDSLGKITNVPLQETYFEYPRVLLAFLLDLHLALSDKAKKSQKSLELPSTQEYPPEPSSPMKSRATSPLSPTFDIWQNELEPDSRCKPYQPELPQILGGHDRSSRNLQSISPPPYSQMKPLSFSPSLETVIGRERQSDEDDEQDLSPDLLSREKRKKKKSKTSR